MAKEQPQVTSKVRNEVVVVINLILLLDFGFWGGEGHVKYYEGVVDGSVLNPDLG